MSRDERILKWTRAGATDAACDLEIFEDEVWWGFWRDVSGEGGTPPVALFPTARQAESFALLTGAYEYAILPCVLKIETRDNVGVPK
jgi:hypothetical protein